jgi:outer membrane protein OmpA-like peptidoglycan-associated protein
MMQKEMNKENDAINDRAYEIYKEHGFKDGNEFADWIEAEKQLGTKAVLKHNKQVQNILYTIVGLLCVIVVILLLTLFKPTPRVELSASNLSNQTPLSELSARSLEKLKVMMVVLDPKANEKVVALGDTHFDFGESILGQDAKTLLDQDVQVLKQNPETEVRMAGYTSAIGPEDVNQKLSEDRANAVRNYLIEKGISSDRITVIGYGNTRPAVYEMTPGDIDSKAAMANMRVLFEVVVKQQERSSPNFNE